MRRDPQPSDSTSRSGTEPGCPRRRLRTSCPCSPMPSGQHSPTRGFAVGSPNTTRTPLRCRILSSPCSCGARRIWQRGSPLPAERSDEVRASGEPERCRARRHMIRAMRVQAAVVQAAPIGFDRARTMDKLERLIAEAARGGAQVAVFPEAFIPAYPRGFDFGTVVGQRTPEGRDWFRRYFDGAIEVPGPDVDRMAAAAREYGIHLVVGVIERDGGTLYCTALFFGPEGYLGKHRKLMPTAAERLIWGFG